MFSVYKNTLWRARKTLFFWVLAMGLWMMLEINVFKGLAATGNMQQLVQNIPDSLKQLFFTIDISTAPGYINARLLSLTLPLLTLIFGISLGNAAIAGEEQHGQLDLLLSNPLSRTQYYLGRLLAMFTLQTLVIAVFVGFLYLFAALYGVSLEGAKVLDAFASVLLLGFVASTLAMLFGALVPSGGMVLGLSSAVLMASYLINAAAPLKPELQDLQPFSVFYYVNEYLPIQHGLDPERAWVLVGITVLLVLLGLLRFNTRDLSK